MSADASDMVSIPRGDLDALQAELSADVQEMLGHSDIRFTRGYTHVATPLTQDAASLQATAGGLGFSTGSRPSESNR